MASSIDSSEGAHTLPRPELNPLLNPLLAENMGRWAEVYFTSAPEKREEAVLELLRELEARNSEAATSTPQAAPVVQRVMAAGSGADRVVKSSLEEQQRCDACGHDNPPRHQFCGMCGSQLGGSAPKQFRLNEISDRDEAEDELMGTSGYERSEAEFREPIEEEEEPSIPVSRSRRDPYDLSLFQSLRKNEFTAELDYDSSPSVRYRYYIGAVLAILILALGYMAWSAGRASQSAQGTPPPPPPAATESTPTPANPAAGSAASNPPKTEESKAVPAANTATESTVKPAEVPKQTEAAPSTTRIPTSTSASHSVPMPPPSANVGTQTFAGNGAEEYAMAQRYLGSRPRDSAEAAKWLWKAMAKHNGPSMVALADLYLKGDGVSKNCDQARVLLDSAAQRGMAGAGERLRNLQAFGCQ